MLKLTKKPKYLLVALAQLSTAQHSTAQHSTAQHNITQRSHSHTLSQSRYSSKVPPKKSASKKRKSAK